MVEIINPFNYSGWDALVASHPNLSFFHGTAWARVLVESYGFTPHYFLAERAVLPLMEVDSWLTGRRGIGLPFTDDCEPLGPDCGSVRKLFQAAVELGNSHSWKYIECRGGRELFDDVPASLTFYGHRLELVVDEAQLFNKMDGSARRAIRKAENEGVTVEISQSLEALHDFYSLHCLTRKRHGLPPPPFHFFRNIHRHILSQNLGMVAVASHRGRKIAAAVYFFQDNRAIYKYGASDLAWQALRPSNLVMWTAMQWLVQHGATSLHLGKTALANEGLRRFKLTLGATEEKIEYVKYDLRRSQFVTDTDAITGWHNRVFQVMPVFAARWVGGMLYRHWA